MTKGKKFKKRIRARQAETGESYSRAREAEGGERPGTKFWYYHSTEYPDEGSVFPFVSRQEAETHAGDDKDEMTFAEREATEEEQILLDFGKTRDPGGEVERLQKWVNDLQAGMSINCVYCGHNYGPDDEVPASMAEVLKEHIAVCPKHPMSKVVEERGEARRMAQALRAEAGWEGTWPFPWEGEVVEGTKALTLVQEHELRQQEANRKWLKDNPGLKEVRLVLTHNEHGTPTAHIHGPDLTTLQVTQPPDAYVAAVRHAYADSQWYREKGPRDDLGPLPACDKKIIVNGLPFTVTGDDLSYEEVLLLAYPGIGPTRILSVVVKHRDGRGASLTPGKTVRVESGMVFSAMDTSNA